MRKLITAATVIAAALGSVVTISATDARAATHESVGPDLNVPCSYCPSGAVCIYPGDVCYLVHPSEVYWSRGFHALHNEYGVHKVFNNQTDCWGVWQCTADDTGTCNGPLLMGETGDWDLTTINYFALDQAYCPPPLN